MTDPIPARDLPAVAAYAVSCDLDGDTAAAEWKLITENERVKHRMIADAAVMTASLHATPPAALNPAAPPDALALAETYWAVYQTIAPELRGGPLPLERLGPKRVEATKAGALAVVAQALPSVGLLDEALRKACAERDKLREGLKSELAERETLLEELLKNTGDEGGGFDSPEDIAVRYVRRLEAERDRLTKLVRQALDDAGLDEDAKAEWLEREGLADTLAGLDTARDPFGVGAFTGHGPGCGCEDCEGARADAATGESTAGPVYGGAP